MDLHRLLCTATTLPRAWVGVNREDAGRVEVVHEHRYFQPTDRSSRVNISSH